MIYFWIEMRDVRMIVGDLFEKKVKNLFDLSDKTGFNISPDLISKEGSFYVEVKASSYVNGGVINKKQLSKFDKKINTRRFYAFTYHSLWKNMRKDYSTEKNLIKALDLRSLFLFPFSVVKAYFDNSYKRINSGHDIFVQLIESKATKIFEKDKDTWAHLGLNYNNYKTASPHEKIHILTRNGHLEQTILSTLHMESL